MRDEMRLGVTATLLLASLSAHAIGVLENPQPTSIQSGIGTITGWHCTANVVQIQIDGGALLNAPSGSLRADTQPTCGRANTGFAYLFNYNTLNVGTHTIRVLADGQQFASATFSTSRPSGEFLSGVEAGYFLNNFPEYGKRSHVDWSEAKQNFSITSTDSNYIPVAGTYIGAIAYMRSGCTSASSNGKFGQNAYFKVAHPSNLTIEVKIVPSLYTCTYTGIPTEMNDGTLSVGVGTFSCSDGAQGTWDAERIVAALDGITAKVNTQVTVGETCHAVVTIGAVRW